MAHESGLPGGNRFDSAVSSKFGSSLYWHLSDLVPSKHRHVIAGRLILEQPDILDCMARRRHISAAEFYRVCGRRRFDLFY